MSPVLSKAAVVRTASAVFNSAGECMVGLVLSRSVRNCGAAALALFAALLLSPRASEAGCGDYVLIGGRHVPMAHSRPEPTRTDAASNQPDHGLPQRPCHGPGCSDGSFPPQAPAPVLVVSIDRWAVAPGDTLPNVACRSDVLAEPLDFVAAGFRLSILRPPR